VGRRVLLARPKAQSRDARGVLSGVDILGLDEEICKRFGQLRGSMRKRGQKIGDFDLLIAATALRHNLTLLNLRRAAYAAPPVAADSSSASHNGTCGGRRITGGSALVRPRFGPANNKGNSADSWQTGCFSCVRASKFCPELRGHGSLRSSVSTPN